MSKFVDITGKQFGDIKVIKFLGDRLWECQCKCGKTFTMTSYGIRKNPNHKCTHSGYTNVDITGMTFNEWTVLGYIGDKKWRCRCSCGEIRDLSKVDITKGRWKSCGHKTDNKFKDITNQTFGELTAIKYLGDGIWLCKCSCGNEIKTHGSNLRTGRIHSCGAPIHRVDDITGKIFGNLQVIKYAGNMKWTCKCLICGTEKDFYGSAIKSGSTSSCGCNRLNKMQETLMLRYGDINPNKCNNPRESWQIDVVSTKDKLKNYINEIISKSGSKPTTFDLKSELNISESVILGYIHDYELEDLVTLNPKQSSGELSVLNYIGSIYDGSIVTGDRSVLNGKELDIYIPDKKLAIEFNGNYWHSTMSNKDKYYHQNKTIECAKRHIRLIHIFQYEWEDEHKQLLIKALLKSIVNPTSNRVIHARNCTVSKIDADIALEFSNTYHIDGAVHGTVNYGLYCNAELIAVMTLGLHRYSNTDNTWEMYRLTYKAGIVVVGGTERLFKKFINEVKPEHIITYIDISKFTGNGYLRLGFRTDNGITQPSYVWKHSFKPIVLSRYQTMKHKLIKNNIGNKNQTEKEIMENNGYYQIYDCGNLRLDWYAN